MDQDQGGGIANAWRNAHGVGSMTREALNVLRLLLNHNRRAGEDLREPTREVVVAQVARAVGRYAGRAESNRRIVSRVVFGSARRGRARLRLRMSHVASESENRTTRSTHAGATNALTGRSVLPCLVPSHYTECVNQRIASQFGNSRCWEVERSNRTDQPPRGCARTIPRQRGPSCRVARYALGLAC
jgi:hypothetical protein